MIVIRIMFFILGMLIMVLTGCAQENDPRSNEQIESDLGPANEQRELTGVPSSDAFASRWPANTDGLVYIWENAAGLHELIDVESSSQFFFRPEPRRLARHDRNHAMLLDGGFFVDDTVGKHLAMYVPMDSFALEFVAKPSASQPSDEGKVFSVTTGTGPDLVVASSNGNWTVQFRDAEIDLGPVDLKQPTHIALSYNAGSLQAFIDGEIAVSKAIFMDTTRWGEAAFLFGGDANGDYDWQGSLENFALYNRALDADEVATNHKMIAAKLSRRDIPEMALVRARVIQTSAVPAPEDIAPYQRGLVVNEYKVIEVLEGELTADQFLAAHWAILDETVLVTAYREVGSEHVMLLERFDKRNELEGERLSQDTDNFLLDLYFDLYL